MYPYRPKEVRVREALEERQMLRHAAGTTVHVFFILLIASFPSLTSFFVVLRLSSLTRGSCHTF